MESPKSSPAPRCECQSRSRKLGPVRNEYRVDRLRSRSPQGLPMPLPPLLFSHCPMIAFLVSTAVKDVRRRLTRQASSLPETAIPDDPRYGRLVSIHTLSYILQDNEAHKLLRDLGSHRR